jgi:hypothetical protein
MFRTGLTTDSNGKLIKVIPNSKPQKTEQITTIITQEATVTHTRNKRGENYSQKDGDNKS